MEYAYKNSLIVNRFVKHSYYTCISKTKFTYACIRRTSEPQDRASEPGLSSDGKTPWAGRKRVCSSSIASSQDFNSVLWVSNNHIRVSTIHTNTYNPQKQLKETCDARFGNSYKFGNQSRRTTVVKEKWRHSSLSSPWHTANCSFS